MDGVLVDSIKHIWFSFQKILEQENEKINFTDEYIKKNLARSLRDNLRAWRDEFNIKEYDLMEFSKRTGEMQLKSLKNEPRNEALIKILEQAKKENIKLGVATSSTKWRAESILELINLRKYFEAVITANDVQNHKPAPDVFLETAKQLNVKPEECVVIEDAGTGIQGAKHANMKTIGLITKYHTEQELSHADITIKNFNEINIEKIKEMF